MYLTKEKSGVRPSLNSIYWDNTTNSYLLNERSAAERLVTLSVYMHESQPSALDVQS